MAAPADPADSARRSLIPHPSTPCPPVSAITIEIARPAPETLTLSYRIAGDLDALRVPTAADRLDPDRLFAHTCCELFVAPDDGPAYIEWNFSPSGQSASFEFVRYRERGPSTGLCVVRVETARVDGALRLRAHVPLPALRRDACLGLSTVIEDVTGERFFWALHHPSDRPDFHHREGFAVRLGDLP
jgi:hypothetical protein